MANKELAELREGLRRTKKRKTIISAVKGRGVKEGPKAHAHFYISTALLDKMME